MDKILVFLGIALSALIAMFNFWQQASNPENRRLNNIEEVEKELEKLRKERDACIAAELLSKEMEEASAIMLGDIVNRIIFLRAKRDSLKK